MSKYFVEAMSANGFEGIKRTSAFSSNKGGDVIVKCEGVTDGMAD